jgi:hypothetical protein
LALSCCLAAACATARPPTSSALPASSSPPEAKAALPGRTDAPPTGEPGLALPEAGFPPSGTGATEPGAELEQPSAGPAQAAQEDRTDLRERVLAAARRLLGHHPHLDCSGYVLAAFRAAGLAVALPVRRSRSEALLAAGGAVDSPRPGDLALFHDTYDRNRNGKADDGITHVALVEAVDGDRVTLLHRGRRVERIRMNLLSPSDRSENDLVRYERRHDSPHVRYLAGELFATYAALPEGAVTEPSPSSLALDTGEQHAGNRWPSNRSRASKPPPSRSTPERARSRVAHCSGSCPSTKGSSSPRGASGAPGEPPSPAP